jgi:uncharacterized membrane protein
MSPQPENIQSPLESVPIKSVQPAAILRWLTMGWHDMRVAGRLSLFHGLLVTLISIAITALSLVYWQILPGAITGFVIIGPFLATGLYTLSFRIEQKRAVSMQDILHAWKLGGRCLFVLGLLLVLAGSAWVAFSLLMFHLFIDVEINHPLDFLRYVLTQDNGMFMLWTILGGLGSALAFAVTVGAMPLLVERNIDTPNAVLISVRAVGDNPVAMVLWAMTILLITGLSLATLMLGFIVLYPLLGHASWHAYRDLMDTESLPLHEEFSAHE